MAASLNPVKKSSVRDRVSKDEWQVRVDLAAAHPLAPMFRSTDARPHGEEPRQGIEGDDPAQPRVADAGQNRARGVGSDRTEGEDRRCRRERPAFMKSGAVYVACHAVEGRRVAGDLSAATRESARFGESAEFG